MGVWHEGFPVRFGNASGEVVTWPIASLLLQR